VAVKGIVVSVDTGIERTSNTSGIIITKVITRITQYLLFSPPFVRLNFEQVFTLPLIHILPHILKEEGFCGFHIAEALYY
jgi:hypothetical protein